MSKGLKVKRIIYFLITSLFISTSCFGLASADSYTSQDLQSILGETPFYYNCQSTQAEQASSSCCENGGESSTPVVLTGSDNEQQAYNFFIENGLTNFQSAAVVGNMYEQSHVDPTQAQDPPVGPGGDLDSPQYVASLPNGANIGWGIVQWTPATKIITEAQTLGINSSDSNLDQLSTQLEIVWDLMSNGTSPAGQQDTLAGIEATTNLPAATTYFFENFEGGGNSPQASTQSAASSVLSLYGDSSQNSGTTVTSNDSSCSSSNCSSSSSSSISSQPSSQSTNASQVRNNVVCLAEQELSTWQSQPNYSSPYPDFTYAATGFLKYTDNNYEEWCADFVSWIYNQAGYPFSGGEDGGWRLPGVISIQQLGANNQGFQWHPKSSGYVPQPGDLALYYDPTQTNPWYHVNIFISSTSGTSTYIGGDQVVANNVLPEDAYGSKSPPSGSVVSTETGPGYYSGNIVGYESPN